MKNQLAANQNGTGRFSVGSGRDVSRAGFKRTLSHLFRMVGTGGFLRCGFAMIPRAVTAGIRLFALALKDTKVLHAFIDGIRGRSIDLLELAGEKMNVLRALITDCCAETVVFPQCCSHNIRSP